MTTQTTAIGRLTDDPVERSYGATGEGKMALFGIAVDTGRDETQFYDCISFGRTAENILKYFVKGRPIHVEGHFQNNNQERTTPGGEKYTNYGMTFLVNRFSFIPRDSTQQDNAGNTQTTPAQNQTAAPAQNQTAAPTGFGQQTTPSAQENPFAGFAKTEGFNQPNTEAKPGGDDPFPF